MKVLGKNEQMKINGGAHYHWYCSLNSFISVKYTKATDAAFNAGKHVGKYPDHKSKTTYGSCTSSW